jgi:large-conductance mechanosensitive channel
MNKFFIAAGQIAVGLIVGTVGSDVVNKLVVKPIEKVVQAKKGGGK